MQNLEDPQERAKKIEGKKREEAHQLQLFGRRKTRAKTLGFLMATTNRKRRVKLQ